LDNITPPFPGRTFIKSIGGMKPLPNCVEESRVCDSSAPAKVIVKVEKKRKINRIDE
jgi:hypothetical protein